MDSSISSMGVFALCKFKLNFNLWNKKDRILYYKKIYSKEGNYKAESIIFHKLFADSIQGGPPVEKNQNNIDLNICHNSYGIHMLSGISPVLY
jgi:hypothetical protein